MKAMHSALIKSFFIIVALLLPAYAFSQEAGQDLGASRVTLVEGDVELYMQGSGPPFSLLPNMSLRENDLLWVPEGGRTEIYLRGGSYLRLGEGTSLTVQGIGEGPAGFYLEEGRIYVNAERLAVGPLAVGTPLTSLSADGGSVFMVDVSPSGSVDVSVLRGSVRAEGASANTMIMAGEALHVRDDGYAELAAIGPRDEWEQWNSARDRSLPVVAESRQYLPEELYEYAPDFDSNGRWVYEADYGYVWQPVVAVSVDWAPYRHGRWAWVGGDYVWISYESWGWAPYHYGRWVHLPRSGWCWVPPRHGHAYWGPGYVAWVRTPEYVAWVPLAPGETYYGYGYYGPGTVSIINITVNKTFVRPAYKNVHVKNGVTIRRHDRFATGRKGDFRTKGNPFLDGKGRFGPPVRPERVADFKKGRPPERHPERTGKVRPGTGIGKAPLAGPSSEHGAAGAGQGKGRGDKPEYASKTPVNARKADEKSNRQYGDYKGAEASRNTQPLKLVGTDSSTNSSNRRTVTRSTSPVLNSSRETGTYSKTKSGPSPAGGPTRTAETARPSPQLKAGQGAAPGSRQVVVSTSKAQGRTARTARTVSEVKKSAPVIKPSAVAKANGQKKGVAVQDSRSKTKVNKDKPAPEKGQVTQGYKGDQGGASRNVRGGGRQPSYGGVQAGGKMRGSMR